MRYTPRDVATAPVNMLTFVLGIGAIVATLLVPWCYGSPGELETFGVGEISEPSLSTDDVLDRKAKLHVFG